jgi:hypothetical protein
MGKEITCCAGIDANQVGEAAKAQPFRQMASHQEIAVTGLKEDEPPLSNRCKLGEEVSERRGIPVVTNPIIEKVPEDRDRLFRRKLLQPSNELLLPCAGCDRIEVKV